MKLKGDTKFKRKLACGLKNDTKNLLNFDTSSYKSKNMHFVGLFCPKHTKFYMKKYRRVMRLMTLKSDAKFEENLTLGSKMIWGISWILMRAVASLKFALQCSAFVKSILCLSLKKYREVMCCNTKEWCKIWIGTD